MLYLIQFFLYYSTQISLILKIFFWLEYYKKYLQLQLLCLFYRLQELLYFLFFQNL